MLRALGCVCACFFVIAVSGAWEPATVPPAAAHAAPLPNAFASGWMLIDTNGNGIADAVCGHIVVPAEPSVTENTAAANLAARLGYGSTGLTLPLVVRAPEGRIGSPRIYVGRGAIPSDEERRLAPLISRLEKGEGGAFADGNNIA